MRQAASRPCATWTRRSFPWCTSALSSSKFQQPIPLTLRSTPEVKKALDSLNASGPLSCIIVGIESHICVTQTAIDLLKSGHKVYVIADGVSSCNKEEVPIALARLRHEGAVVTSSESLLYECVGDAGTAEYVYLVHGLPVERRLAK